jgi:ketosteroid isomerase-like protein
MLLTYLIAVLLQTPPAAPLPPARAWALAGSWVEAFNRHDLDAILAHYAEDVELRSPVVIRLLGDATGVVTGRPALRSYFAQALAARPDLRFEIIDVFAGVNDVTVYYRGVDRRLIVETMTLDPAGRIRRVVVAHQAARE